MAIVSGMFGVTRMRTRLRHISPPPTNVPVKIEFNGRAFQEGDQPDAIASMEELTNPSRQSDDISRIDDRVEQHGDRNQEVEPLAHL